MSFLFVDDPFEYSRSTQNFCAGLQPEDPLATPTLPREFGNIFRYPVGYVRPWRLQQSRKDATGSAVSFHKDRFEASLDVPQFKAEEISVKVSGNVVTVEGKHEEKEDGQGFISRHFVRKYVVPKGHDLDKLESKLSSDGVLSIVAPKVGVERGEDRSIPVIQTGVPAKPVEPEEGKKDEKREDKKEEKEEEE